VYPRSVPDLDCTAPPSCSKRRVLCEIPPLFPLRSQTASAGGCSARRGLSTLVCTCRPRVHVLLGPRESPTTCPTAYTVLNHSTVCPAQGFSPDCGTATEPQRPWWCCYFVAAPFMVLVVLWWPRSGRVCARAEESDDRTSATFTTPVEAVHRGVRVPFRSRVIASSRGGGASGNGRDACRDECQ
jgi:hypothetical protein